MGLRIPRSGSDWRSARHRVRQLTGPTTVFCDVRKGADRTLLIVSSGRSGSTWLAEALDFDNGYRVITEPFRDAATPLADVIAHRYLDPRDPAPEVRRVFERLLEGRFHGPPGGMNHLNRKRVATRRLVKEIRINNLVPWLSDTFPTMPIVYLLRHPVPVIASQIEASERGWNWALPDHFFESIRQPGTPFEPLADLIAQLQSSQHPLDAMALRWCLQNYVAVTRPWTHHSVFVFYEELLREPEAEFGRLFSTFHRPFDRPFDRRILDGLATPSATTLRDQPRSPGGWDAATERWRRTLTEEDHRRIMGVVEAFGLDQVYGPGPMPLLRGDELRSSVSPEAAG